MYQSAKALARMHSALQDHRTHFRSKTHADVSQITLPLKHSCAIYITITNRHPDAQRLQDLMYLAPNRAVTLQHTTKNLPRCFQHGVHIRPSAPHRSQQASQAKSLRLHRRRRQVRQLGEQSRTAILHNSHALMVRP